MAKYTITMPDGKYEVEADNADQAQARLKDHFETQRVEANQKAYNDLPAWQKPVQAADDTARLFAHGATAGWADPLLSKFTGEDEAAKTQAAMDRSGFWPSTIAKGAGAVSMLPSFIPKAIAAVGGGPLTRLAVGTTTAAGEGATYGGAEAAAEGRDVPKGILAGGLGGAAGNVVGQAVGKGINKVADYINPQTVPGRRIPDLSVVPENRKNLVDNAATLAEIEGKTAGTATGTQTAQKQAFKNLLTYPVKTFTPAQRSAIENVAYGDTGTNMARGTGNLLDNILSPGAIGAAAGFGTGNPVTGLLAAGAAKGLGKAASADSAAATQAAVDDVRRMVYGQPKYAPAVTQQQVLPFSKGVGFGSYQELLDYLGAGG